MKSIIWKAQTLCFVSFAVIKTGEKSAFLLKTEQLNHFWTLFIRNTENSIRWESFFQLLKRAKIWNFSIFFVSQLQLKGDYKVIVDMIMQNYHFFVIWYEVKESVLLLIIFSCLRKKKERKNFKKKYYYLLFPLRL